MRIVAGVLAGWAVTLAGAASAGEAGPADARPRGVAILSAVPAEAASPAARAYASVFAAVGLPVEWVRPDRLGRSGGGVLVVGERDATDLAPEALDAVAARVADGGSLITEGDSPLSRRLGVRFGARATPLDRVADAFAPGVEIRWRRPAQFTPFAAPEPARVFTRAADGRGPVVVTFRHGRGQVLFLGVGVDEKAGNGSGRFPFLVQAAVEALGLHPALRATGLIVYADLGDHRGEDPVRLARSWRERGIGEVHLGAWDALGANEIPFDAVIEACHRAGIRVFAWLEPPEISRAFWDAHPEWREKTATGADAQVDWRRLMALTMPECLAAASAEMRRCVERFAWDGVDLAEIYFESPTGLENPELFTPMNAVVRREFERSAGFDPAALFDPASLRYWKRDPTGLEAFLAFRRDRVVDLHRELMGLVAGERHAQPGLALVLTLVDALYDPSMRDAIAVDTARVAPLAASYGFALQVEDPYTLWTLGPQRYAKIAADYARIVAPGLPLSIDINVVEREAGGFPTRKQTGSELYALASQARRHFSSVCFYSEATIAPVDRDLLPAALAAANPPRWLGPREVEVESDGRLALDTGGPWHDAMLDGRPWPAGEGQSILLPRGRHRVAWSAGQADTRPLLNYVNATLLDAAWRDGELVVRYASEGQAFLGVGFLLGRVAGVPLETQMPQADDGHLVRLPGGEHEVRLQMKSK